MGFSVFYNLTNGIGCSTLVSLETAAAQAGLSGSVNPMSGLLINLKFSALHKPGALYNSR